MTPETVITIGQQALTVTMTIIAILLLPALLVGLLVSIFQAATQINEVTLSFIPKLLITFLVLILAGPWILQSLLGFMNRIFEDIPHLIG